MPNRTVPPLTNWNLDQAKEVVWDALHMAREDCISPDNNGPNDTHWEDICTAMAWLQEAAGCEEIMDGEDAPPETVEAVFEYDAGCVCEGCKTNDEVHYNLYVKHGNDSMERDPETPVWCENCGETTMIEQD
jgi:hypothetical protein